MVFPIHNQVLLFFYSNRVSLAIEQGGLLLGQAIYSYVSMTYSCAERARARRLYRSCSKASKRIPEHAARRGGHAAGDDGVRETIGGFLESRGAGRAHCKRE